MTTTYAIDDGNSNQLRAGLSGSAVQQVAQRLADERGACVYVYEVAERDPDSDDDGTPATADEYQPADVRVAVGAITESDCASEAWDVSVTVWCGEARCEGEITLCRGGADGIDTYGDSPDTWIDGALLRWIDARGDRRAIMDELHSEGCAAVRGSGVEPSAARVD